MNLTTTSVGVASFFVTVSVSVFSFAIVYAADSTTAADLQCPVADNVKTVYQAGKPRTYSETRNGATVEITNYYGQKCTDTKATGFCVSSDKCLGTEYKALDGTEKPIDQKAGGGTAVTSGGAAVSSATPASSGGSSVSGGAGVSGTGNGSSDVTPNSSGSSQTTVGAAGSSDAHSALESSLNPTPVASQNVTLTPADPAQSFQQTIQNVDQQGQYQSEAQQQNTLHAATLPDNASVQPAQIVQMITTGGVSELGPSTDSFAPAQKDASGNTLTAQQLSNNASTFGGDTGTPAAPTTESWYKQMYDAAASSLSTVGGAAANVFNETFGISSAAAGDANKLTQTWNFGNLDGGVKWDGSVSCTGRQTCFSDAYSGARADFLNVSTQIARGNDTLGSLMNTLSPSTENNTSKMIDYLSSQLNITPTTKLDFSNETQMVQLFNNVSFLEHSVYASDVMDAQVITSAYKSAYEYRVAHPK